jgi:hypothetical protein
LSCGVHFPAHQSDARRFDDSQINAVAVGPIPHAQIVDARLHNIDRPGRELHKANHPGFPFDDLSIPVAATPECTDNFFCKR